MTHVFWHRIKHGTVNAGVQDSCQHFGMVFAGGDISMQEVCQRGGRHVGMYYALAISMPRDMA